MYQISFRAFSFVSFGFLAFFDVFWPILLLLWLMLLLYDGRWRIELWWLHQFLIKIGIFNLDFLTTKHQMLKIKIHNIKVEKILKGSLDSISSPLPSVKIQIMGGKDCLRLKGKTLLGIVNKRFVSKRLLTAPSDVLPLHLSHP